MLIIDAPYIAEIAPLDDSAPLAVYKTYTSPSFPGQVCVMIEGELKPFSAIQGRYTIITSLKQGETLPAPINPIKRMREAFQYTQKQLADLIGCTQKDISRYENGTRSPSAENIQKLSKAFNVTMEEMTILIKHFKDAKEKSPE